MLFHAGKVERVLRLQKQSYALLKWLNQHLGNGGLSFSVAHRATSGAEAAEEWLVRNRAQLPTSMR